MSGPLTGIRVVDLTALASGPLATAILGDQGADVIKVEPPGTGDLIRHLGSSRAGLSAMFATLNRNKRSIVLNLREPRGIELLGRLVETADVFVQNFRPGVVDRMGIGEARLRELRPDLVYVSISGFGEKGPYANRPVYDSVMQAYSGMAAQQADPETGVPEFVRNVVCDKAAALTNAQAITAALFARERGRGGQHLKLSMLHASIAFLWPDGGHNHTWLSDAAEDAGHAPAATLPAVRPTADGFVTATAIKDHEFRALCRALGRPDLAEDPRFADAATRARHATVLHELLMPITRRLTTAELGARLGAEEVPFAVVNPPSRLHEDPQVVANDLFDETPHPVAGPMRVPRPVGEFGATPTAVRRPAPTLGEHTDELLAELGIEAEGRAALREAGVIG